ncbi:MAG: hypothetical protein R3Y21_04655 [Mycoplasmatota bacterium]
MGIFKIKKKFLTFAFVVNALIVIVMFVGTIFFEKTWFVFLAGLFTNLLCNLIILLLFVRFDKMSEIEKTKEEYGLITRNFQISSYDLLRKIHKSNIIIWKFSSIKKSISEEEYDEIRGTIKNYGFDLLLILNEVSFDLKQIGLELEKISLFLRKIDKCSEIRKKFLNIYNMLVNLKSSYICEVNKIKDAYYKLKKIDSNYEWFINNSNEFIKYNAMLQTFWLRDFIDQTEELEIKIDEVLTEKLKI